MHYEHKKHFIFIRNFFIAFFSLMTASVGFSERFSILTYNVQMRPVLDQNDYKATRISPKLNFFDIATIQESFAKKSRLMKDALHPEQRHFTDKRHCFSFVDSGLSTLSKFPVIFEAKEIYHSYAGFSDSLASKGILLTRLLIDGLILDLYTTHMQAGYTDSENRARREQAKQVIEFVNRHSPREHSVLIVGDFNMSPKRPDRKFEDFKPQHYSHERDMIQRTDSFQLMLEGLELTDVQDLLEPKKVDEIERMVFRAGCNHEFRPEKVYRAPQFIDEHGAPLSDGLPLGAEFILRAGEDRCDNR